MRQHEYSESKMIVHFQFDTMEIVCADDETMQRRTHVFFCKFAKRTCTDQLIFISNTSQPEALCVLTIGSILLLLAILVESDQELFTALAYSHELWRLVYFFILQNIFLCSFLHFDID